jgi:hypothetical protein
MFSASSAITNAGYPRPGPAAGRNAAIAVFGHYSAVKAHAACAALPVAGG